MIISVIIPTLNAAAQIDTLLSVLKAQTVAPDDLIVVDSGSTDGTAALARECGATVIPILREQFDHGGTRDMALRESRGDLVLFLTQDALPKDKYYIERLIAPFENPLVAAVSGRQAARPDARPFEKAIRTFRYPAESRTWDNSAIQSRGIQAFFLTDVCSAYRRSAYESVGGFVRSLPTNEDMLIAASLLDAGYHLAYSGSAVVYHSHNNTLLQEYRRNRLVGRFLQRYKAQLHYAKETGEGIKLVRHVAGQLVREGHIVECFAFGLNCAARLLGNRAGHLAEKKEQKSVSS